MYRTHGVSYGIDTPPFRSHEQTRSQVFAIGIHYRQSVCTAHGHTTAKQRCHSQCNNQHHRHQPPVVENRSYAAQIFSFGRFDNWIINPPASLTKLRHVSTDQVRVAAYRDIEASATRARPADIGDGGIVTARLALVVAEATAAACTDDHGAVDLLLLAGEIIGVSSGYRWRSRHFSRSCRPPGKVHDIGDLATSLLALG